MRKNSTNPLPSTGSPVPAAPVQAGQSLRHLAEAKLSERRMKEAAHPVTVSGTKRLIYELEVHQIELEMQNDQLVRIQEELETSRAKYFELFNLAPVGYLSLSETGIVLEANLTAVNLLGVERSMLLNKPMTNFITREDQDIYYLHSKKLFETNAQQVCELRMTGRDGVPFWVRLDGVAAQSNNGTPVYRTTLSDITDLKQAEEKLKYLLKDKEVLIREVHHRVKNNFAVVSSLLGLQSYNIRDKDVKEMFMQSRDRIRSMALLHERFYQSQDLTHINFSEYIRTLADDLFKAYKIDLERISIVAEVEDIVLNVDKVIPCGLIINELISNALKYGFPKIRTDKGQIKVTLRKINGNEIELAVMDNGVGLPEDFDIEKNQSLGLKLVTMLAEGQLGGKLKVNGKCGAKFQIQFALQELVE